MFTEVESTDIPLRVLAKNRNFFEYLWENSINKKEFDSLRKSIKSFVYFSINELLKQGYISNSVDVLQIIVKHS